MVRRTVAIILLASALARAAAQPAQPVLRIAPFESSGMSPSEASMMERLVSSYVAELRRFRLIDASGQDLALSETETALSLGASVQGSLPLSADYVLSGAIGRLGDLYMLTIDITKVATGEKLSVSDTAASVSDIVLRARTLTRSLFGESIGGPPAGAQPGSPDPAPRSVEATRASAEPSGSSPEETAKAAVVVESPTVGEIVGMWRGDKGLETVRIFANGTALAVLSGGGTLKLRISIDGSAVVFLQDQPNDPSMYRSSAWGFDQARRIAAAARPMRWILYLSDDRSALSGTKETTAVSGTGSELRIDNDYVRDASWARIAR